MPTDAVYSSDGQREALGISPTRVQPVLSVPSEGRQRLEAGVPVPAWRALQTDEVTGFRAEGVAVDEKQKCCLAYLTVPGTAVSRCAQCMRFWTRDLVSRPCRSVPTELQAAGPDVPIVGAMALRPTCQYGQR